MAYGQFEDNQIEALKKVAVLLPGEIFIGLVYGRIDRQLKPDWMPVAEGLEGTRAAKRVAKKLKDSWRVFGITNMRLITGVVPENQIEGVITAVEYYPINDFRSIRTKGLIAHLVHITLASGEDLRIYLPKFLMAQPHHKQYLSQFMTEVNRLKRSLST